MGAPCDTATPHANRTRRETLRDPASSSTPPSYGGRATARAAFSLLFPARSSATPSPPDPAGDSETIPFVARTPVTSPTLPAPEFPLRTVVSDRPLTVSSAEPSGRRPDPGHYSKSRPLRSKVQCPDFRYPSSRAQCKESAQRI